MSKNTINGIQNEEEIYGLKKAIETSWDALSKQSPDEVVRRTQCLLGENSKSYVIPFLGQEYTLKLEDKTVETQDGNQFFNLFVIGIILHYMTHAQDKPLANKLISFRELWGVFPLLVEGDPVTFFKDYDIAYTNEGDRIPPKANAGPAVIDTIYAASGTSVTLFIGEDSWAAEVGGSPIASWYWDFADGTPATSILEGTRAAPIEVGFPSPGFRYVELTGLKEKPSRDAVTGIVIHSDTPMVSSFECSDPHLLIVRTFSKNSVSSLVSKPCG